LKIKSSSLPCFVKIRPSTYTQYLHQIVIITTDFLTWCGLNNTWNAHGWKSYFLVKKWNNSREFQSFTTLCISTFFYPFSLFLPGFFSHTSYNQIFEFDFKRANKLTKRKKIILFGKKTTNVNLNWGKKNLQLWSCFRNRVFFHSLRFLRLCNPDNHCKKIHIFVRCCETIHDCIEISEESKTEKRFSTLIILTPYLTDSPFVCSL